MTGRQPDLVLTYGVHLISDEALSATGSLATHGTSTAASHRVTAARWLLFWPFYS